MYSKHTFLFPFRWDIKYAGKESRHTPYSKRTDLTGFHRSLTDYVGSRWEETTEFKTDTADSYNAWTYFYPFVRKAIFPDVTSDVTNNLLRQYCFDPGQDPVYCIHIKKAAVDKTFELPISEIVLMVYELGVGVLSFSLTNNRYDDPEDILHINDYGRRLYPQFVGAGFDLQPTRNNFLANQISISNADGSVAIQSDFSHDYAQLPVYLPPHILQLLNGEKRTAPVFTAEKLAVKEAGVRIEPVLDDRMFVLCWYGNKIADRITQFSKSLGGYSIEKERNFWYRFIYVDNSDISSPDPLFRGELLKQTTYTRWASYGTLFGVTRYSFVLITAPPKKSDDFDFGQSVLSVHLSTIYTRLVLICLVQRAALLRFSGEVSFVSRFLTANELTLISEQVQQLNRSYVLFENRLYFSEVTAQEQGIELYDLLHRQMRIPAMAESIDSEINKLHDYLQTETNESERVSINRLSIIGGLFGLAGFFISYFGLTVLEFKKLAVNQSNYGWFGSGIVVLLLFTVPLLLPSRILKGKWTWLKHTGKRRWLLYLALATIGALVIIPVLMSINKKDQTAPVQPVIDSTATRKIDSLRTELLLLRQLLPKPSTAKPTSTSR